MKSILLNPHLDTWAHSGGNAVLIDPHANPGDLSPVEFARAAANAGLEGVVVTETNRVDRIDDYLDAVEDAGLAAFVGVELPLDKGVLVLIPRDPEADPFYEAKWQRTTPWTLDEVLEAAKAVDAVVLGSHPYCRDQDSVLGDRVYAVKGMIGLETRVGHGKVNWDQMADAVAVKKSVSRLGSSGGDAAYLGYAATVFLGDPTHEEMLEQIANNQCMPIEFEDPTRPRDRSTPRRERAPRDDRGGRGRRDDRGGRGRGRGRGQDGGRGGRRY